MSEATIMLAEYKAAESKALAGQSYTINGRSLTRANLTEIRKGRAHWKGIVNKESATSQGGSSLYSVADFSE